ncbi:SDR family NAD(P)-dependent oxidoreductase [Paraburkholderia atlantica]|uniref:SDR family NAD(P)-dependent oxidoreductase n=1 Tax=Paraburkholderia atlantica TaxID=2654982 RepID=UPI0001BF3758|nr:SDR family NAD(P)-dependent oxidoreductase [Paraburkholderia atlantica]
MRNATKQQFMRVWAITGASRGPGALIAQAALDDGNAVLAAGRNVEAIIERFGESPALLSVKLDVTDEQQAKAAAAAAVAKFGRIDVLIYNAGFGQDVSSTHAVSPEVVPKSCSIKRSI